jgi:hypothetical protein
MLNKPQAQKLAPLLNSKEWPLMVEYLQEFRELTIRGVVMAQSESELRQVQGKLALVETLLKLKDSYQEVIKNGN